MLLIWLKALGQKPEVDRDMVSREPHAQNFPGKTIFKGAQNVAYLS
jgi:hypothetical protein